MEAQVKQMQTLAQVKLLIVLMLPVIKWQEQYLSGTQRTMVTGFPLGSSNHSEPASQCRRSLLLLRPRKQGSPRSNKTMKQSNCRAERWEPVLLMHLSGRLQEICHRGTMKETIRNPSKEGPRIHFLRKKTLVSQTDSVLAMLRDRRG